MSKDGCGEPLARHFVALQQAIQLTRVVHATHLLRHLLKIGAGSLVSDVVIVVVAGVVMKAQQQLLCLLESMPSAALHL